MRIPVVKRITKEDLGGAKDIPAWIDPLLNAINQFLDPVGTALQGKLTFSDNIQSTIIKQTFTQAVELVVNPQSKFKTVGIVPVSCDAVWLIAGYNFNIKDNGGVGITLRFSKPSDGSAAPSGTQIKATVLLLFG